MVIVRRGALQSVTKVPPVIQSDAGVPVLIDGPILIWAYSCSTRNIGAEIDPAFFHVHLVTMLISGSLIYSGREGNPMLVFEASFLCFNC